jgi:hypothetical protein
MTTLKIFPAEWQEFWEEQGGMEVCSMEDYREEEAVIC